MNEQNCKSDALSPLHNDLYWNVFPVKKNTLEAYVTTYCYFDRSNIFGGVVSRPDGDNGIIRLDDYSVLENVPSGYMPEGDSLKYRKGLNDPTLKYDELW